MNIHKPTLLVLVKSFSCLFAQFALCNQFVEQLNLGKQRVARILRTPTCNYKEGKAFRVDLIISSLAHVFLTSHFNPPLVALLIHSPSKMNLMVSNPTKSANSKGPMG